MPVVFPLATAHFMDRLPIKEVTLPIFHNNEMSRTRQGQVITAYNGPTLWQGTVTLAQAYNRQARAARAAISLAQTYMASFMFYDPTYEGPAFDNGAGLVGRTPFLTTAVDNGREVQISGLAPNYRLSSGDALSWSYGTNPVRFAYHSVVFDEQATSGGTITVEVTPMVIDGSLVANRPVNLIKPLMVAKIVAAEIGTNKSQISAGSNFDFMQVVGA